MRLLPSSLSLTAFAIAISVGMRNTDREAEANECTSPSPSWKADVQPAPSQRTLVRREVPDALPHDLARLTKTLSLSTPQQEQIHPALRRIRPDYDPAIPQVVLGSNVPRLLGPPLGQADFEDILFAILDGEQQLDYAVAATDSEAWWRSVVARLKADLEQQTDPGEKLPSPPASTPSSHRDRQLTLPSNSD